MGFHSLVSIWFTSLILCLVLSPTLYLLIATFKIISVFLCVCMGLNLSQYGFTCLIMLVRFWNHVWYILPYDCATTVAPECIDRASEGLKRKSKQNYFEKAHLFCERIHFSKEVSNLQQTCSINVCTQKRFVIFKDMYCTSCNQTLLVL